jgi:hypothetical protein
MEFTLSPQYRRQYAVRAVFGLVLTLLLTYLVYSTGVAIGDALAVIFLILTAVSALQWHGRSKFATRVSSDGLEIRGYTSRRVTWAEIKEIQVVDFARVGQVRVRGRTRNPNGGGSKKVAYVRIVRHSGRTLDLKAPLVTRDMMRALAHPVRLALLEQLQRHGPATASQLSPHVGATPSVTSWHLRHLAGSASSATPNRVPIGANGAGRRPRTASGSPPTPAATKAVPRRGCSPIRCSCR